MIVRVPSSVPSPYIIIIPFITLYGHIFPFHLSSSPCIPSQHPPPPSLNPSYCTLPSSYHAFIFRSSCFLEFGMHIHPSIHPAHATYPRHSRSGTPGPVPQTQYPRYPRPSPPGQVPQAKYTRLRTPGQVPQVKYSRILDHASLIDLLIIPSPPAVYMNNLT